MQCEIGVMFWLQMLVEMAAEEEEARETSAEDDCDEEDDWDEDDLCRQGCDFGSEQPGSMGFAD